MIIFKIEKKLNQSIENKDNLWTIFEKEAVWKDKNLGIPKNYNYFY